MKSEKWRLPIERK